MCWVGLTQHAEVKITTQTPCPVRDIELPNKKRKTMAFKKIKLSFFLRKVLFLIRQKTDYIKYSCLLEKKYLRIVKF